MRKFKSIEEGKWFEVIPFMLSDEQKQLLASRKPSELTKQIELKTFITNESTSKVDSEKLETLSRFYESIKPKERNYKLISFDVCQSDEGNFSGILNYRINNEHKQLRFQ